MFHAHRGADLPSVTRLPIMAAMSESASPPSGPRVLVVEDEFLIRMTLFEALSDEGFDVVEAASGDDALVLLRADPTIRLLLTDLQLPGGLDGRALALKAREAVPDLPIIYMSGRPDAVQDLVTSLDVVIAKPYLPSDVCVAARRLTRER